MRQGLIGSVALRSAGRAAAPTCRRSSTGTCRGKIQIDPTITHVMLFSEINNAFELIKRGESIRGVVTF